MYCMSFFKAVAHPVLGVLEKYFSCLLNVLGGLFIVLLFHFGGFEVSFFCFEGFRKFGGGLELSLQEQTDSCSQWPKPVLISAAQLLNYVPVCIRQHRERMKDSLVAWCHLFSRLTGTVPLHQGCGQFHAYPWNTDLCGLHRVSMGTQLPAGMCMRALAPETCFWNKVPLKLSKSGSLWTFVPSLNNLGQVWPCMTC